MPWLHIGLFCPSVVCFMYGLIAIGWYSERLCYILPSAISFVATVCDQPRPTTQAPMTTTGRDCYIPTIGGTAETPSACVFPFSYKGVTYTGCSTVDNSGYPWCYTSYNYREDHLWGNCRGMSEPPSEYDIFHFIT